MKLTKNHIKKREKSSDLARIAKTPKEEDIKVNKVSDKRKEEFAKEPLVGESLTITPENETDPEQSDPHLNNKDTSTTCEDKKSRLPFNCLEAIKGLMDDPVPGPSNGSPGEQSYIHTSPHRITDHTNLASKNETDPVDLPKIMEELLKIESTINQPSIQFEPTPQAAKANWELLKAHDFDLEKICNNPDKRSITDFGSEFKNTKELEKLLRNHPRWKKFKSILTKGVNFDLEDLPEELRQEDLEAVYKRGNHKSAVQKSDFLSAAMKKEISQGWVMVLPVLGHATMKNAAKCDT